MMRAFTTPLLAALTLAAAVSPAAAAPARKAGPAAPQGDVVNSDLRCLITMAFLGQDKQRQQAALIGAYFYAGRLSVRAPGLDLPGAVKAQEAKMTPQQLPAEAQRCGPLIETTVRSLQVSFSPPGGAKAPAQPQAAAPPAPAPEPAPASAPTAPAPTTTPK